MSEHASLPATTTKDALGKYAPYVTGVALALPVLIARYPPMTDLPHHEALVGILRHFDDASMFPPGLYVHNLGEPNQLFHMAAWALSYLVATDVACKIVVALTVFAIPVCAARFATHVGANRVAAVVVSPVALGWLFSWGLIANLIGLAALLWALPVLDRLARDPTPKRALYAVGGAVLLYFAHEAMMFVYAGAALLFLLGHPLSLRATLLRVSPFVASGAIAYAQAKYQLRFMSPAVAGVKTMWVSAWQKLARVPDMLFHSADGAARLAFFALFALVLGVFLVLRHKERATRPTILAHPFSLSGTLRPLLDRYRFELFAAACFGAYLAFPFTLNGATLVYERFFAPACVVFAIVAAPHDLSSKNARVVKLVAPVLPLATLLLAWPSFVDADRAHKQLDALLPLIEKGSAVAELDIGPQDPTRDFSLASAAARAVATRGGRLLYTFTDSAVAPAFLKQEYQWNEPLLRASASPWAFMPAHDLKRFRYVLFRTTAEPLAAVAEEAFEPYADVRGRAGDWILFESKLELEPLLSPDAPDLPTPRPRTLRGLMLAIEKRDGWDVPEGAAPHPDAEAPVTPGHM